MPEDLDFVHTRHGWCHYTRDSIYGLFVLPEYRRRGIARRLVSMALSMIRADGYDGPVHADVDPGPGAPSAEVLAGFYRSMGLTVGNR